MRILNADFVSAYIPLMFFFLYISCSSVCARILKLFFCYCYSAFKIRVALNVQGCKYKLQYLVHLFLYCLFING